LQDVKLTRDLFEFGRKNGYVLADTRDRGRVRVKVGWGDITIPTIPATEELYVQPSLI